MLHQKGSTFLGFSSTLRVRWCGASAEYQRHFGDGGSAAPLHGHGGAAKSQQVVHAFGDSPKLAYDVVIYNDEVKDDFLPASSTPC